jgi:hypothetical protein
MSEPLHHADCWQQIEAFEWDYDRCRSPESALATITAWTLASLRTASLLTERCITMWWTRPRCADSGSVLHWQAIADANAALWEEWLFSAMTSPERVLVIQSTLPTCIRQRCVYMPSVPTTPDVVSYVAWGIPESLGGQALSMITRHGSGFMVGHDGEFVLAVTNSGEARAAPS